MLKRRWILLPVILLCLVSVAKETPREAVSQTHGRPNILLVLTDDQDAGSISGMPNVQSQLVDHGTTYDRTFATTPLCCPSRTSILRGQYAHNHGLWDNKAPEGGFRRFQEQRMRGAFKVNDQGKVVRIDATEEHDTDYFARKAEDYVRNRKPGKPWFLMIATNAPHVPAQASARNENAYAGRTMPKTPSFNEADVSDKASLWRDNALLPEECPSEARKEPGERLQCVPEGDEAWRNRM
jgi:N-acetylglucosamine-6-sulfatase